MADHDPREIITCPYNMAHQVEHYRMHIHLQKCRKQHPNCRKETCPFDATHIVNDVELNYHVQTCPKRLLFDSQQYVVDDGAGLKLPPAPAPQPLTEENWDDENVESYKPDPSKRASHIITKPKGLTPSERRKVRMDAIKVYRAPDAGPNDE